MKGSQLHLSYLSADTMNNELQFLQDTFLFGPLPFEITHLTEMVRIDLSDKAIEGPLAGLFSRMPKLEEIILEDNKLTGPIPQTFADENPLLTTLNLGDNGLTGPFHTSLVSLSLTSIILYANEITGSLPDNLGSMVQLGKCWVCSIRTACCGFTLKDSHHSHPLLFYYRALRCPKQYDDGRATFFVLLTRQS